MKKLFISVPMKNRTEENIKRSMERMHKIAELVFGEELEVIPSYIEHTPPNGNREAVWYLGESIKKLSEADYFIGIHPRDVWKGCRVESEIAISYEIPTTFIDVADAEFLKDCLDIERDTYWSETTSLGV